MTNDVRSEPYVAENPYEVLGLLPSAPQELVVEVYWHSVGQIRANGVQDPDSREALERLNNAYALLSNGSGSQEISEPQALVEEHKRGLFARIKRQRPNEPTASVDHWRRLTVAPSASGDVIDLAYAFWVRRTRGTLGSNAGSAIDELREAYEPIRTHVAPNENGESSSPSPSADADEPQAPSAALQTEAMPDPPTTPTSRGKRTVSRIGAVLGRLAGRVRTATWKLFKKWAADPLFEHDPNKPKETRPRPKAVSEPRPADVTKPLPVSARRPELRAASPIPKSAPNRPLEAEAPPPQWLLNGPCLIAEDGRRLSIVSEALTIGTAPECDIVAELRPPDTGVVAAHIWVEGDRVVLHVLEDHPRVLVNGVAAVWAFLEDGDKLEIDGTGYRFET